MILKYLLGPELPVKMDDFSLVSTAQGLMAVGGYDRTHYRYKDEILQLKCEAGKDISECKWEEYRPKKLDVARHLHVVIPLPSSYEICNNWKKSSMFFKSCTNYFLMLFNENWNIFWIGSKMYLADYHYHRDPEIKCWCG